MLVWKEFEKKVNANRKKSWQFDFVVQRKTYDCSVACFAMYNHISYEEATKQLVAKKGEGVHNFVLCRRLNANAYTFYNGFVHLKDFKD